jgi:hypothetical protein
MALPAKCSVVGCDKEVRSLGFCTTHYYRLRRHGVEENTRPKDWGKREKHPLYQPWINTRRYPTAQMCDEWRNDFWQFVADVEERPSKNVFLKRIDESKPLGKGNACWVAKQFVYNGTDKAGRAEYLRNFRKLHPESFKRYDAKKKYGISGTDFVAMKEKQNGLCAICNKPETQKKRNSQETMDLAIDHCHKTHKIRGLLCSACNQGLGRFKDDVGLLESAIEYLKRNK